MLSARSPLFRSAPPHLAAHKLMQYTTRRFLKEWLRLAEPQF